MSSVCSLRVKPRGLIGRRATDPSVPGFSAGGFLPELRRRYHATSVTSFVISGCFTGLAGALWAPLNGLTTPDILYWPFSGEIVFMTVLGGFRRYGNGSVGRTFC